MPRLMQTMADQISVSTLAIAGQATLLFGQVDYDRKVWVYTPSPGIFISQNPITRVSAGFALPTAQVVQFDLPAKCEMYALAAAGTVQVSRYTSTVMETTGDLLTHVLQALLAKLR